MKRLFLFLLLWVSWAFSVGTLTFLGPLRWTVNWSRLHHWADGQEKARVLVLILFVVLISFFLTKLTLANKPAGRYRWRFLYFLLPMLGSALSVAAFMHPAWMSSQREETVGPRFTIGGYPEAEKLVALKNERFTTVVSLLHPAIAPFEPALMDREREAAARAGLTLISIPLLPWVSDNAAAVDSLRSLVKNATGKIYIHCYLGRDRVNLVRRLIEQETQAGEVRLENTAFRPRSLDTASRLERGPVYRLAANVFLTPFPTREEYLSYVLAGRFGQVVSLSDTTDSADLALTAEEQKTLDRMKIPFVVYHVSAGTTAVELRRIIGKVKKLPLPLLIHSYSTGSKEAQLFRRLYP